MPLSNHTALIGRTLCLEAQIVAPHVRLEPLRTLSGVANGPQRAVDLAPDDGKSQMLLGRIYYRQGRKAEAESHFKASITADPVPSEPYYNLAVLYEQGLGLSEDKSEAAYWFEVAGRAGDQDASRRARALQGLPANAGGANADLRRPGRRLGAAGPCAPDPW